MQIRNLGGSGLRVSAVGLGCNNFGQRTDLETSRKVIHKAIDLGITLFDTADIYAGMGGSESVLGEALAEIVAAEADGGNTQAGAAEIANEHGLSCEMECGRGDRIVTRAWAGRKARSHGGNQAAVWAADAGIATISSAGVSPAAGAARSAAVVMRRTDFSASRAIALRSALRS